MDNHFPPIRLLWLGIVTTILSLFNFGYQFAVTGLPAKVLQQFINNSISARYPEGPTVAKVSLIWGAITAALMGAMIPGALVAQPAADLVGRKPMLFIWNNIMVVAGSSLMPIARITNLWELLLVGRLICGFTGGSAVTLLPVYLTECSPVRFRGFLGSMHAPGVYLVAVVAVLFSYSNIMGNERLWGFLFAFPALPALLQICLTPLFPESPQYDYIYKSDTGSAILTVKKYFGKWAEGEQMEQVFQEYDQQKLMAPKQMGIKDILISSSLRGAVLLSFVIGSSRSLTGDYALMTYSYRILFGIGMPHNWIPYIALGMQIGVFLVGLPGCFMVESLGRRPLLLYTLMYIWCGWVVVVILQIVQNYVNGTDWLAWPCLILLLITYVIVYPIGASLITWFIASELVPQSARASASSISMVGGATTALLTTLLYPILADVSNPLANAILFVIPLGLVIPFIWIRLPETKNRTTAEISADIDSRSGRSNDDKKSLVMNEQTEAGDEEIPVRSYGTTENKW